ncbi:hypothetical protein F0562_030295 [Nyssa sinensis]|uniref:Uncharacterized protein n=1 Tax=Nyssa sinensis TaxID=561372 RepID=A0A5J5B056_9ASTE|nr:hypothetical protein F0562_030295 [Nyssa sinensis]
MHKMKEGETVKEYAGKLMEIVNKIKLFGEPFPDKQNSGENVDKFTSKEHRTSLKDDETVEDAFQARQKWKHQGKGNKNGGVEKGKAANTSNDHGKKKEFPPLQYM